jgi:hypothetical protein
LPEEGGLMIMIMVTCCVLNVFEGVDGQMGIQHKIKNKNE